MHNGYINKHISHGPPRFLTFEPVLSFDVTEQYFVEVAAQREQPHCGVRRSREAFGLCDGRAEAMSCFRLDGMWVIAIDDGRRRNWIATAIGSGIGSGTGDKRKGGGEAEFEILKQFKTARVRVTAGGPGRRLSGRVGIDTRDIFLKRCVI
ncbi:hypothetical protein EVAR_18613_1 [Eumeta japonica]|uniref:Uncharacterized protein n=1 Tax=Eumeta variegata TaxID=151549 RepID=A0A4C1V4C8_EUMVA|nr:hypothetical protein EVAR_18613_1 [Eumeta japonica]